MEHFNPHHHQYHHSAASSNRPYSFTSSTASGTTSSNQYGFPYNTDSSLSPPAHQAMRNMMMTMTMSTDPQIPTGSGSSSSTSGMILPRNSYGEDGAFDGGYHHSYFPQQQQQLHQEYGPVDYSLQQPSLPTPPPQQDSGLFHPWMLQQQVVHSSSEDLIIPSKESSHHHLLPPSISISADPGSFYPVAPPWTAPPLYGASVSALAYDGGYQALYVASNCQTTAAASSSGNTSLAMARAANPSLSAASALVTQNTKTGMVYSSCAGHPQASTSTLQQIYQLLYQGSTNDAGIPFSNNNYARISSLSAASNVARIPPHAFRPTYGRITMTPTATTTTTTAAAAAATTASNEFAGQQMGISHILPLASTSEQVASVSPAAVRIHTQGGLCVAQHPLEGMLCGILLVPGNASTAGPTHMLVGGLPIVNNHHHHNNNSNAGNPATYYNNATTNSNWNSGYQRQVPPQQQQQQHGYHGHVHSLDLWQGLRIVSSRTLYRSGSSTATPAATDSDLAVTSMATTLNGASILVGCSDGFVRMLDGRSLREVAKVKSHAGGVVQVATNDNATTGGGTLLATTGYAIHGSGGPFHHAFPDTTVLIYDIRYLGRGGIPHPFSGMQGGPRFLSFIPSQQQHPQDDYHPSRLLIASGQAGGGVQIIQPFHDDPANQNNFFLPPLDRGESVTAMCFDHQDCALALGTSAGNVLQYKMAKYPTTTTAAAAATSTKTATTPRTASNRAEAASSTIFVPGQGLMASSSSIASEPSSVETSEESKLLLEMPPYIPALPGLSLEASLLQTDETGCRIGANDKIKSIFSSYIMCAEPKLSCLGTASSDNAAAASSCSMGKLANQRVVEPGRRKIAATLLQQAASTTKGDFLVTVPISQLKVDLMENHRPATTTTSSSSSTPVEYGRYQRPPPPQQLQQQQQQRNVSDPKELQLNPNKLLFSNKLNTLCYEPSLNQRKKGTFHHPHRNNKERILSRGSSSEDDSINDDGIIPPRYRLTIRPSFKAAGTFDHSHYNDTGLWPGWDYPPTMPNAFASSVLMLLYFIPEVRAAALKAQFNGRIYQSSSSSSSSKIEKLLSPELGFLFHQIDSRSRHAMSYPLEGNDPLTKARIGAWFPSNFLTTLAVLPEAEALQILDGSPAAVETPRRPEAFFRFLLYQLDKELSLKKDDNKLMDSLSGIDFVSINEFITGTGPPMQTCNRALTVDLAYDRFLSRREAPPPPQQQQPIANKTLPRFGEVLRHSLCRETRLRAWNKSSRSYETTVQRKIATSLPSILSLSCACAGRKEEDGLFVWRTNEPGGCFLPDMVEIELEHDGNVVVHELIVDEQGNPTWTAFRGDTAIPAAISTIVSSFQGTSSKRKQRYRLEAVLSFIRDDLGDNDTFIMNDISSSTDKEHSGHHVLHVRVSKAYQAGSLSWQIRELERLIAKAESQNDNDDVPNNDNDDDDALDSRRSMVLTGDTNREIYLQRKEHLQKRLAQEMKKDWILANGFVVSETIGEDARSFHVLYKEPCLVIYKAVDEEDDDDDDEVVTAAAFKKNRLVDDLMVRIPPEVFQTKSLSTGKPPVTAEALKSLDDLPKAGDLLALDAEFVSVQDEQTTLNETGQKFVLQETRHAVARISIVDCRSLLSSLSSGGGNSNSNNSNSIGGMCGGGRVLVDDHVLPRESIVDCLTRFSGIVPSDLDPKQSPHHLVSTRSAYVKLRYLVEAGCIFVGHGLSQDFWHMNLVVPPDQIIDTVHIFHQDRMRYISLRFLANYVLHRDMQQDTHDSIEDAKAAWDLYRQAAEWKRQGQLDKVLQELYEYGQKTDWKVGVD